MSNFILEEETAIEPKNRPATILNGLDPQFVSSWLIKFKKENLTGSNKFLLLLDHKAIFDMLYNGGKTDKALFVKVYNVYADLQNDYRFTKNYIQSPGNILINSDIIFDRLGVNQIVEVLRYDMDLMKLTDDTTRLSNARVKMMEYIVNGNIGGIKAEILDPLRNGDDDSSDVISKITDPNEFSKIVSNLDRDQIKQLAMGLKTNDDFMSALKQE